ncbi:hypothetical protein DFH08DRAFT_961424 [Mycena albidolilacea]|uniref:Uncharacterized protein n=1 Tax=Mycena albidolilacea TaxID=1033008 RepID=A0AAD7ER44_9AGAR|nr:hypothetical protein DFH08DRAFT_961424 [Mycena albidolilacea]
MMFAASATGAKKIAMNWVQYWKKIVLKRHVIIQHWSLEGHPRNPASIHNVESMTKLRNAWESGDCYWQKLNSDEQKEVKEMYEEMVTSGEVEEMARKTHIDKGKAKDAPGRRVWEEDETADEEGTRQKEKERRKAEKEKEKRKAEKEKEKAKVKARKSEKGSKKRKADDTTDPHLATRQSTSRKKKRKWQDNSDSDEPTLKSHSKQAPDAPKSRFEVMHNRLRVLATGKSGSITAKLPPAMRKGPPGVRPGTVEFTALGLKGMDEDSDDDSDDDN